MFFDKFQKRETAALTETGTKQRIYRRDKEVAEAEGARNRNGAEVMPEGRIVAQRNLPQREATPITVEKIQFGKDFFIPGVIFKGV